MTQGDNIKKSQELINSSLEDLISAMKNKFQINASAGTSKLEVIPEKQNSGSKKDERLNTEETLMRSSVKSGMAEMLK